MPRLLLAYHFFHESQLEGAGQQVVIGTKLTGPQATGGMKEYGVDLCGQWESFVEKALAYKRAAVGVG